MNLLKSIMSKIVLLFIGFSLFYVLLIIFMPKVQIWYEMEKFLQTKQVIFDKEKLKDDGISLLVREAKLYYDTLNIASIESLKLIVWGVYNQVVIKNFYLGKDVRVFKGLHIKKSTISYFPFMNVNLQANGNFGTLKGSVNLFKRKITLLVQPTSWLKKQRLIMKTLKKTKQGYSFVKVY